jgi:hypothetical protein
MSIGPSGPREAGEGVEEEEQRVVDSEWLPESQGGGAQLRVTLLAAGFVIGASGASVRELSQKTRTSIQSWTEKRSSWTETGRAAHRSTRVFRVRGAPHDVSLVAEIVREAVARYNELCEGKRRGEFVRRSQRVRDVEFSYQPPPKTATAHAHFPGGTRSGASPQKRILKSSAADSGGAGRAGESFHRGSADLARQRRNHRLAAMGARDAGDGARTTFYEHGIHGMHGTGHGGVGVSGAVIADASPYLRYSPRGAAMFSLPAGTDPAIVAAAAQAAAVAAAAAAANRAVAGAYAHATHDFGNAHFVNGGFSPPGSQNGVGQSLPRVVSESGLVYGTECLPSTGSFDRLWSGADAGVGGAAQTHGFPERDRANPILS